MTSFTSTNVSALPVVAVTTSRLVNLLERFVVPVAAAAAGFIGGKALVFELGTFLSVFVPGIQTMDNWVFKASKSGTVTISVALVITGVVLMSSAVIADRLIAQFLGLGRFTMILRRGVVAFLFGAGVRALAESFAPFKGAIEAFSEVSVMDDGNGADTDIINGGDSRFKFEELKPIPTPPVPTPPVDEGKLVIDGQRGGGGGELIVDLTPIPGEDKSSRRFRLGRSTLG